MHATLCSILSDAVEGGFLTHNPAWRTYRYAGKKTENKITDEETAKKIIAALEKEPKALAGDRYVYFSAEMESLLREYRGRVNTSPRSTAKGSWTQTASCSAARVHACP